MHPVNQIWGAALIVGANLHASAAAAMDCETGNAASDETSDAASDETSNAASDETGNAASDETPRTKSTIGVRHRDLPPPKSVSIRFLEGGETVYVHGVEPKLSIPAPTRDYPPSTWFASAGKPGDDAPRGTRSQPNGSYCDAINQHDDDYGEPEWRYGDRKPFVYPCYSGQAGLRSRPDDELVTRLGRGVYTSGPFMGSRADDSL